MNYQAYDPERIVWYVETFEELLQKQRKDYNINKSNELLIVDSFFITLLSKHRIHTLFNNTAMSDLLDSIFMNEVVRDFVLTLTDRLSCFLACFDDARLEVNLSHLLLNYNKGNNNSLIPNKIFGSLQPDDKFPDTQEEVVSFLMGNTWLVVIISCLLYTTQLSYGQIDD